MKEKIEQLAKGIFQYELPKIVLSQEALEFCVQINSTYENTFTISNQDGSRMKGILYSSSARLSLESNKFIGTQNTITYHFEAKDLEPLQTYNEEIWIVSDCGELTIPVTIHTEAPYCDSSIGKINSLEQFAALTKHNWKEAITVFTEASFVKMLDYQYNELLLPYQTLKKSSEMSQAMDEFLYLIHAKQPVTITIDKTEAFYIAGPYNFMDKLMLHKESYGFFRAQILCEDSFIRIDKKELTEEDFVDDSYELDYIILNETLEVGKHFGKIIIETPMQRFELPITVTCQASNKKEREQRRMEKQLRCQLVRNYLDFRMNTHPLETYIDQGQKLLSNLKKCHSESIRVKLYQLHLMMAEGKHHQVSAIMDELTKIEDVFYETDPAAYGFWLYLKELNRPSEESAATTSENIKDIMQQCPQEFLLDWCLLYLNQSYRSNPQKKYSEIKQLYRDGKRSPVLYYEAAALLHENASLLKELSEFELQILCYGMKYDFSTKDIQLQTAYLAGREKKFHPLLARVLIRMYEKNPEKEILQAICSYLIRGNQRQTKYQKYYELGIEQQLRAAQLPEYYIYSLAEEGYPKILPGVIAYFNFNNHLPERKKAFYYACLIKNAKDPSEVLRLHQTEILELIRSQLSLGNCSNDVAVLCDAVITKDVIDEELAMLLQTIRFEHMITVKNPRIQQVVTVSFGKTEEAVTPMEDLRAHIRMEDDSTQVYLIDEDGYRYLTSMEYTIDPMTHLERFDDAIQEALSPAADLSLESSEFSRESELENIDTASEDVNSELTSRAAEFIGTTKQMYELWKECTERNIEVEELEERLLAQMLFTESMKEQAIEVFLHYQKHASNRKLAKAFLSFCAYDYLIRLHSIADAIIAAIRQELSYEENEIGLLAFLKYKSQQEQLDEADRSYIEYQINAFEQKNRLLPFFLEFGRQMRLPQKLYDKSYIEYHGNPKSKVTIAYAVTSKDGSERAVIEEMHHVYYGIFLKEIVVFADEEVTYEITEHTPSGVQHAQKGSLAPKNNPMVFEESNYERLNHIIDAARSNELSSMEQMLSAYAKMDYCVGQLFGPIDCE